MWDWLERVFGNGFMPHGHCYLWTPSMVWLQVISNLAIGLSYMSISATLVYMIRRITNVPFRWMYLAFGAFIVTCGFTHFTDVATVWHPIYWFDGGLRGVTAMVSVGTALLLFPLVPKAVLFADAQKAAREQGITLAAMYDDLAAAHAKATEAEARFRAAAEGMEAAFYIFDAVRADGAIVDFLLLDANTSALSRLRTHRDQAIGASYSTLYPEARSSGLIDEFAKVVKTGVPYDAELEVFSGERALHIHLRAVPLANGVAITSSDITEQKRSERERELHSAVVRNMNEGLCLVRVADGVIVFTNQKFDYMLGYESGELQGKPMSTVQDHVDPAAAQTAAASLLKEVNEHGEATYETRNLCKDRRVITCRATASRVRDKSHGEVLVIIQEDITEKKRAEEERDGFFTLSLDMLCVAGFDGFYRRLNPAWEATLGFTIDELKAKPFVDFVHPDDQAATIAETRQLVNGSKTVAFENRYRCKDGRYRILQWRAAPSPVHGLIFANARDVTELRQAQQALAVSHAENKSSLAEKEVLLMEIHHRVKNNLQVVSSLLKLHQDQITDPEARSAFQDSQNRVRAIALLHEKLYQSKDLGSVGVAEYCESLLQSIVRAQGTNTRARLPSMPPACTCQSTRQSPVRSS